MAFESREIKQNVVTRSLMVLFSPRGQVDVLPRGALGIHFTPHTCLHRLPFPHKSPALSINTWQSFSCRELCSRCTAPRGAECHWDRRGRAPRVFAKYACSHQPAARRDHKVTSFMFSVVSTSPTPSYLPLTTEADLVPEGRTPPANTRRKLHCN